MRKNSLFALIVTLVAGVIFSGVSWADEVADSQRDIYAGYFSQEKNYGELGETSGHSHYVKFYPKNRILRLYIPFPYSKTVEPAAIRTAFDAAARKTSGSAYIKDKFGVMNEKVIAHLDTFRWVEGQVMYDCSLAAPCKINFSDDSMTLIKPGVVLEHEILYEWIKD